MWEICKNAADAAKEFDRTMDFIAGSIKEYKAMLKLGNEFIQMDGVLAQSKRSPIGVMLNLGCVRASAKKRKKIHRAILGSCLWCRREPIDWMHSLGCTLGTWAGPCDPSGFVSSFFFGEAQRDFWGCGRLCSFAWCLPLVLYKILF